MRDQYIFNSLIGGFALLMLYCIIFLVIHAGNEAECLEKGYPEIRTAWNLKSYCVNIDGAVTGVVEELK